MSNIARRGIPKEALARRLAFVGTTGSGKTYTAKGGVERKLQTRERVVVIDPLDVWWGLRLSADGKKPSPFEVVIFGGKHGDMQISENGGKLLGEAVATAKESCIVSLGSLRTEAARRRFMVAFLDALYEATDPDRAEPYTVVFDEADMWAPQKPFGGHAELILHLMEEIVRRGRVRGFTPWLISQRPAIVNKNVLSQVDGMVAMQLTGTNDRNAIGAWIEGHADRAETKELLASLAGLQQGHGLLWVPRDGILERMHFAENATFDSSRTPKRGEKKTAQTLKPMNLDRLKNKLAAVEAETKANDPAVLKKQIADLQAQIRTAEPRAGEMAPSQTALAREYRRGLVDGTSRGKAEGHERGLREATAAYDAFGRQLAVLEGSVQAAIRATVSRQATIDELVKKLGSPAVKQPPADTPTRATASASPVARAPSPAAGGDGNISPAKQRILDAVAWMASLGNPQVQKDTVAFLADASPNSSAYANNLGALRSAGLLEYPAGGMLQLTDAGNAAAVPPPAAPTHEAIIAKIAEKLAPAQMRIITTAAKAFPADVDKAALAESVGVSATSSAFANNLGRLRTLGLITYPASGKVRADERLFP